MNRPAPKEDSSVSYRRRVLGWGLAFGAVALIALALLGTLSLTLGHRRETPPTQLVPTSVVAARRPFNLVGPTGKAVSDIDFRGKYTLVYFGYTGCQQHCPIMLAMTASALEKLGHQADRLVPIFITVDPDHDTPKQMGRYTAKFSDKILGLTGSEAQTESVEGVYGADAHYRTTEDGSGYVIDHSDNLYLVGPDGVFIAELPTDGSADDLASLILHDMNMAQPGGDGTSGT